MSRGPQRSGLLLLDKPVGATSHQMVAAVRRALRIRRVGHAGTLDPLASGLLPILIGTSTRLVRFLHEWEKSYTGVIRLGAVTPTGDAESAPADIPSVPTPPASVIARAVAALSGRQLQRPPAYSAKKVGGIPAYRLARSGIEPRLAPSMVTVHRLKVRAWRESRLLFAARVSSGTYLRSLARDLGEILGTGAYLERLVRTGIGPMRLRGAVPQDALTGDGTLEAAIISPETIPLPFGEIALDAPSFSSFRHGNPVPVASRAASVSPWIRVLAPGGTLAGIGEIDDAGLVRPRVVLSALDAETGLRRQQDAASEEPLQGVFDPPGSR